ncbi:MAG: asparagine synthase (glutamine-hydrolyzing) [Clostridiales bacterium]|nr:asparagine synthase (glutamine-hydrolyzing) [Clostridiales bacterium]
MCGIVGFSGPAKPDLLKRMTNALFHRGPDDEGIYADGQMNLGMRRLAIIDVAGGRQPVSNEDATVLVVFNGEIYNYVELRRELESRGHVFKTDHSDTEVIVHLYEEDGESWPLKVNGMFAVAIWDLRTRKLTLYRDRLGKKPLYYCRNNNNIVFASEIKALLCHQHVSRELDLQSLYDFVGSRNTSAPRSIYRDIKQLLPGCYLSWHPERECYGRAYWEIDFRPAESVGDESEVSHTILGLLDDAVRIRMRCDVDYGAFLSGGVDSSTIVSLMQRHSTRRIKTFSLAYADVSGPMARGKEGDRLYSAFMAKHLGTDHSECVVCANDFLKDARGIAQSFDEPFAGCVSGYFLARHMKPSVSVALAGDGGDELFGSYLAHRVAIPIDTYCLYVQQGKTSLTDLTSEEIGALFPYNTPQGYAFLASVADRSISVWRDRLRYFNHDEVASLFTREMLEQIGYPGTCSAYKRICDKLTARDVFNKALEIDQKECRDMADRVAYAKDRGLEDVVLNTNGTLMTREKAKAVIRSGLDAMYVGIDA